MNVSFAKTVKMVSDESIHSGSHSKDMSLDTHDDVGRIHTSGDNNEYIIIGSRKYLRDELMEAFGGTLNPGLAPPPTHNFGNPGPTGLSAFALTTFVLSMCNARAMGITTPNIVIGLTAFYGGAVQLLAGIWELIVGNTFGGTALASYGAFWLSYMAINVDAFGIAAAYGDDSEQLANAVGFFLLGWAIFTAWITLCTLKSTAGFFGLFFTLTLTFILLAAGEFTGKVGVTRGGGVMGVITAFLGFYNAFAGTANRQNSYLVPHPFHLVKT